MNRLISRLKSRVLAGNEKTCKKYSTSDSDEKVMPGLQMTIPNLQVPDLPGDDFVSKQFDNAIANEKFSHLDVLLSTPRSGSTLISDLIYRNSRLVMHEYFHPTVYMQELINRWGGIALADPEQSEGNLVLNPQYYAEALIRNRANEEGRLAVNVHGKHIQFFEQVVPFWTHKPINYVRIFRKNKLRQAISHHIASESGSWSSVYESSKEAGYSFESIKRHLDAIWLQEAQVNSFIKRIDEVTTIYYEDLIDDFSIISKHFRWLKSIEGQPKINKQSSDLNTLFYERFMEDIGGEYLLSSGDHLNPMYT